MPAAAVLLAAALACALWPRVAAGQDTTAAGGGDTSRVEIIASDSLVQMRLGEGDEAGEDDAGPGGGGRVQELIGDVRLRQGTTLLRARRATRYRQRREILFAGDVVIVDEGDTLWADRVRYDSRQKVGRATGDVRVSSGGEVLLAGPTGRYFFDEKRALFPERVMLVDSARVLKSRGGGEYFSRDERAEFYQGVRVFSDSTYLEADSVTYHRDTEVSEARGQVFIERRGDRGEGRAQEGDAQSSDAQEALPADTARPPGGAARPDTAQPGLAEIGVAQPDPVPIDPADPVRPADLAQPDTAQPDTAQPDTAQPPSADTAVRAERPALTGRRPSGPHRGGRTIALPVDTTRRALLPDTTARTLLWGRYAYNDPRAKYSRVEGRALLVRLQPPEEDSSNAPLARADSAQADSARAVAPPPPPRGDSARTPPQRVAAASAPPDTLVVRARQLETTRSDTLRRLVASGAVRLWQKDLQTVADSAVYDRWPARDAAGGQARRQESRFFGSPLSWSSDGHPKSTSSRAVGAQLSGDSLRVAGRGGAVRRLFARGNAFLAQEDSALAGRLQQLKGRRITGHFARDSTGETALRRLLAGPNAETIYFQKKDDGTLGGAVQVSSDSIAFQMRGGALRKMRVLSGVEGRRYDAADVPDPFRLDGLVWAPERRPQKAAFLTEPRVRRRLVRPPPPPNATSPGLPPAAPPPTASSDAGS